MADEPLSAPIFAPSHFPKIEGTKALIVINMQNLTISAGPGGQSVIQEPPDLTDKIKVTVPYFRRLGGEVIWVTTVVPEDPGRPANPNSEDGTHGEEASDSALTQRLVDLFKYLPSSSQVSAFSTLDSPERTTKYKEQSHKWSMDEEDRLRSDEKIDDDSVGFPQFVHVEHGYDLVDELQPLVDPVKDLVVRKNYYSAFDETGLLLSLRMKMVTHIYLAGALTNMSIYNTAADASSHGFQVSVIEDCLGWRSESQHLEAMHKMADVLGVSGVDSEEIIEEAGGRPLAEFRRDPAKPTGSHSRRAANFSARGGKSEASEQTLGEGDSSIIHNAVSAPLAGSAFDSLKAEILWQVLKHRGGEVPRRVAVQGEILSGGSSPLYRHPADESPPTLPFTPTVEKIGKEMEQLLGQPFNHVLIQMYRDGDDNISEHSDKVRADMPAKIGEQID